MIVAPGPTTWLKGLQLLHVDKEREILGERHLTSFTSLWESGHYLVYSSIRSIDRITWFWESWGRRLLLDRKHAKESNSAETRLGNRQLPISKWSDGYRPPSHSPVGAKFETKVWLKDRTHKNDKQFEPSSCFQKFDMLRSFCWVRGGKVGNFIHTGAWRMPRKRRQHLEFVSVNCGEWLSGTVLYLRMNFFEDCSF